MDPWNADLANPFNFYNDADVQLEDAPSSEFDASDGIDPLNPFAPDDLLPFQPAAAAPRAPPRQPPSPPRPADNDDLWVPPPRRPRLPLPTVHRRRGQPAQPPRRDAEDTESDTDEDYEDDEEAEAKRERAAQRQAQRQAQRNAPRRPQGRPPGASPNLTCPTCHREFATAANLKRHLDAGHSAVRGQRQPYVKPSDPALDPGGEYTCDICGRAFPGRKDNLHRHVIETHTAVKDQRREKKKQSVCTEEEQCENICRICGTKFHGRGARSNLVRHERRKHPEEYAALERGRSRRAS